MAGLMVFPGAQPSRSRNGGAIYAELRFYEPETTIPKTVWADEALTVPLSFPVVSDDAGRFVAIWADADDPYTVNWATADGQDLTLDDLTASQAADAMILQETEEAITFIEGLVAGYAGTVLYDFSTTTTDSDPGPGLLRFNNATLASVTSIYADNVDANGVSATAWLDSFDNANVSANRGTLTIRSMLDSAKFAVFYVSGAVTDGTGYRKVPVTWIDGTTRPADLTNISVNFTAAGPTGVTGDAGYNGWSPVFAVVSDGARRVEQVTSWTGGTGTPPASPVYVGPSGFTTNIALATDIRGQSGSGTGDMLYSENLQFMANNATSRSNLGLGSAAVLSTGTAVNNVVQWSGTSTYPAGNGSAITNIVSADVTTLFYGDASDGNVTVSSTVTLTSPMFYDTLTLAAGADLRANGWPVFCRHLDLSNAPAGALKASGSAGGAASNATGGVAGTASTAGQIGVGAASRTGGNGGSVAAPGADGVAGLAGGQGGGAGATGVAGTGAAGGAVGGGGQGAPTATEALLRRATTDLRATAISSTFISGGASGASGPGGGGGASGLGSGGGGGASGAGGDILAIYAKKITRGASTAAGALQAMGGAGGAGGVIGSGGGGGSGGSGGGGGWVYIVTNELAGTTATNAVDVSGGAGGAGSNSPSATGGSGGGAGLGGRFTLIVTIPGTIVDTFSGAGNTAFVAASGTTGGTGRAATTAQYSL